MLEPLSSDVARVFDKPDHPDDGRRVYAAPLRLVIEANVAARHGRIKRLARFAHPVNHFAELPHHFGPFGRSEVQTISQRERASAAHGEIAARFGNRMPRPCSRLNPAVARVRVERHRKRAPLLFYSYYRSIRAGKYDSVCSHHVVILAVDPFF